MWVSRVRVTGGFLAGLDLDLSPGLNVIVGPRGAGKTTLLELLRHALALPEGSSSRDRESLLRNALGPGEIVVDLKSDTDAHRLVVDLRGGGQRPELTTDLALMLGQNELEEIADSPSRRLALIDLRAGLTQETGQPLLEDLRRATSQLHSLRSGREELQDQLRQRPSLAEDRQRLQERERDLLARNAGALAPQRERLAQLERESLQLQEYLRTNTQLRVLLEEVSNLANPIAEASRKLAAMQTEPEITSELAAAADTMANATCSILGASEHLSELTKTSDNRLRQRDIHLREETEPVRSSLDQVEKGLGAVTAELRDIETLIARLDRVQGEVNELRNSEDQLRTRRKTIQASLEGTAESLFIARNAAAAHITEQLDHRVQISVQHFAETSSFRQLLVTLLQGSGLKYNALAESLAYTVLPSTLLKYVEDADVDALADSASIGADRAARIISTLNTAEALSSIATASVNDAVDFKLKDGATLKSAKELSTGQKCAVTMPIVLTDSRRVVILDQPEDHLDNQFLVDRIVSSLIDRTQNGAQTIVATHNPNIPVLGSASMVAQLASDGTRGQVQQVGPFDSSSIVDVITSLMEGGRAAFERRAEFYHTHSGA